jgi:hypothetical protein
VAITNWKKISSMSMKFRKAFQRNPRPRAFSQVIGFSQNPICPRAPPMLDKAPARAPLIASVAPPQKEPKAEATPENVLPREPSGFAKKHPKPKNPQFVATPQRFEV